MWDALKEEFEIVYQGVYELCGLSERKENFLKYRYDLNFLMQKEKSEFKKSLEALFLAFAEFTVTKRLNLSAIEFLVKRTLPLDYSMT